MKVTVKFHGIIGDMLERKSMNLDLADDATIADAQQEVVAGDETVAAILKQTRPFIDGKQADRSAPLHDGAEVIFMRPIAGG